MDSSFKHHAARIDEFTESVEQLWQSEEQQASSPTGDNSTTGAENDRGSASP